MSTNTLNNFSLYLWKNPEGLHVTVTTNYNLPTEKRSFFSFGKQTYKSWRAYNLHQPQPLLDFFADFKNEFQPKLKTVQGNYWISKLGVNTGTKGRRTAPGAMILAEDNGTYMFYMQLKEHYFEGVFDDSSLTSKQRKGAKGECLGAYTWKNDDDVQDYAEAF
jgi:hypothetical protein